ncbi:MAG: PspC domain-containing protein [Candidatus Magasanikbacteria bacterium]|nr:PspC domain-containing protein [Candidatus Magasanikbacteria bacterium]
MKKLYKSKKDKKLSGVLGGVGEYLSVDANILRVIFVLLVFTTGFFPMIAAYVLATVFLPENPNQ